MYQGDERRKYKRVKELPVVKIHVRPHEEPSSDWHLAAVLNMGAGGALFYYNQKVKSGTKLDIRIDISSSKKSINCVAEVVRVISAGGGEMFLTAVVFKTISEGDRDVISRITEESHAKK